MTTPIPTFSGEVQFRRYSDTSTQGASIVLSLADRDELSAFIGKEGKRFMAVLVEVGDDEKPVEPKLGPLAYWLVLRCNEPEFWRWLQSEFSLVEPFTDSHDTAEFIKDVLGIGSRKEIDGNARNEANFHRLIRGPYSRWLTSRGVLA